MGIEEVEALCRERNLPYKGEFLKSLSDEQRDAGYIKFNIPDIENLDSANGEGVWGWVSPEDKLKHDDDRYHGEITAILCNTPINFYGILWWGSEVKITCHGSSRPTLSKQWVTDNILNAPWFDNNDDNIEED